LGKFTQILILPKFIQISGKFSQALTAMLIIMHLLSLHGICIVSIYYFFSFSVQFYLNIAKLPQEEDRGVKIIFKLTSAFKGNRKR